VLITKLREILAITIRSPDAAGEMVQPCTGSDARALARVDGGKEGLGWSSTDKTTAEPGEARIVGAQLVRDRRLRAFRASIKSVAMSGPARSWEIAGVSGNGQSELLEALSGIRLVVQRRDSSVWTG